MSKWSFLWESARPCSNGVVLLKDRSEDDYYYYDRQVLKQHYVYHVIYLSTYNHINIFLHIVLLLIVKANSISAISVHMTFDSFCQTTPSTSCLLILGVHAASAENMLTLVIMIYLLMQQYHHKHMLQFNCVHTVYTKRKLHINTVSSYVTVYHIRWSTWTTTTMYRPPLHGASWLSASIYNICASGWNKYSASYNMKH